jgi:hypothetical protein
MPKTIPSIGLTKGIEVPSAGGSLASCVRRRRKEKNTYVAAKKQRTRTGVEKAGTEVMVLLSIQKDSTATSSLLEDLYVNLCVWSCMSIRITLQLVQNEKSRWF